MDTDLLSDAPLLVNALIALIVGVIVGLERQIAIARDQKIAPDIGGVRTFPLIAIVGALAAELTPSIGPAMPVAALIGLVVLIAAHHMGKPVAERDPGLTTEAAALATFLIGALVGSGMLHGSLATRVTTPVALAVVVALLLSVKSQLHAVSQRLRPADLFAGLQLLVVAVVMLPLMPDRGFGPYEALNPAQVLKMVVLIGAIGLVGFVANLALGSGRALFVTGLVGGLVSSTAVAFNMARRAKETPALICSCTLSIVAASSVMLLRVLVAASVLYPPLVPRLTGSLLTMFVFAAVAALPLVRGARAEASAHADVDVKNPFELKSAMTFAAAFAVVVLLSRFLRDRFGDGALYLAAVVAGLTDVDAITLSTAALAKDGLALEIASGVIIAACVSNTIVKGGIAFVVGGRAVGFKVARVLAAMLVGGVVAIVVSALS